MVLLIHSDSQEVMCLPLRISHLDPGTHPFHMQETHPQPLSSSIQPWQIKVNLKLLIQSHCTRPLTWNPPRARTLSSLHRLLIHLPVHIHTWEVITGESGHQQATVIYTCSYTWTPLGWISWAELTSQSLLPLFLSLKALKTPECRCRAEYLSTGRPAAMLKRNANTCRVFPPPLQTLICSLRHL